MLSVLCCRLYLRCEGRVFTVLFFAMRFLFTIVPLHSSRVIIDCFRVRLKRIQACCDGKPFYITTTFPVLRRRVDVLNTISFLYACLLRFCTIYSYIVLLLWSKKVLLYLNYFQFICIEKFIIIWLRYYCKIIQYYWLFNQKIQYL